MSTHVHLGGPLHGKVREVPDQNSYYVPVLREITLAEFTPLEGGVIDAPLFDEVRYERQRFVAFGRVIHAYVAAKERHRVSELAADVFLSSVVKSTLPEVSR